ncbi:MAG: hypothetical protein RIR26_1567 [Pseudomonadota bacterium]|jgi:1-acyl-sn-glycerol-3-phosphate acyltransferase
MLKPIKTLAFWLVFLGTGLLYQLALVFSFLRVSNPIERQRAAQRGRLHWSAWTMRWFFSVPPLSALQAAAARLPEQFILVCNHRSNLDPLFVFVIGRPLVFLSKKSVLKAPVIGRWMRLCGDIAVNRSEKSSREKSLQAMRESLNRGSSLLVFPEGTRQADPEVPLGSFKDGAFALAAETGVPLVALVLHNTHQVWTKGSLFLNFLPLKSLLSEPIVSQGRTPNALKEETVEKMMKMIQSLRE